MRTFICINLRSIEIFIFISFISSSKSTKKTHPLVVFHFKNAIEEESARTIEEEKPGKKAGRNE